MSTTDPDGLTVLEAVASGRHRRPLLAKAVGRDPAGAIRIHGYDKGFLFKFHVRHWPHLAAMAFTLHGLAGKPHHGIVRGAPVDGLDLARPHRRLIHPAEDGTDATLQDVPRNWCALDLDQSPPLGSGTTGSASLDWRANPRGALEMLLERDPPECFRDVDCVASFSASQGFKPTMRWRAFYLLDKPIGSKALRAVIERFNKTGGIPSDPALASAAQPHYTAGPVFREGVEDPLPGGRVFTFERGSRRVVLPAVPAPSPPNAVRSFDGKFPIAVVRVLDEMKTGDAFHQQWIKAFAIWFAAFGPDVDPVPLILAVDDVLRNHAVPLRGEGYREQAWRQMSEFAVALRRREQRARDAAALSSRVNDGLTPEQFAALERFSRKEGARQRATTNDSHKPQRDYHA
ncbi:MAG: hypothetical protein NTV97_28715 [Alphaproteobacteria bacterium]|nr:hypothetical protein [Alphaproteobacteria bacterium]